MKTKTFAIVVLCLGVLMMIVGVAVPVYKIINVDIIGGADWPTFLMYLQETVMLLWIGVLAVVTSVVLILLKRK